MKIASWRIEIELEDGEVVYIADVPKYVATVIDEYLTELEAD